MKKELSTKSEIERKKTDLIHNPTVVTQSLTRNVEIFIKRHIEGLEANVFTVFCEKGATDGWDWQPHVMTFSEKPPPSPNTMLIAKVWRRLGEIAFGVKAPHWPEDVIIHWERYLAEFQPSVVLAEFAPVAMCIQESCQRYGVPLVTHFHGYDASLLLQFKNYRDQLPSLFSSSAAIIVVSNHMQKTLIDYGCPQDKIHVIPCGAPVDDFFPKKSLKKLKEKECRFLSVGRFVPMKGPFFALRAFAEFSKCVESAKMTMIGEGQLLHKAKKMAKHLGISSKVDFLGFQPNTVIKDLMAESDVFLHHSVTSAKKHVEGWGVAIAEAAASGLPVVATNHGGIPDQVIHGKTGFLVEEKDWKKMAEYMTLLARDVGLRQEMGKAGRENIKKVGNLTLQIQRLQNVLESVSEKNQQNL